MRLPVAVKKQVANAALPINYREAVKAIAKCEEIDECKDWRDRAAALASYARQTKDTQLRDTAQRIRTRAMLRIGELLLEIAPKTGGLKLKGVTGKGRFGGVRGSLPHPDSRASAALKAGLTAHEGAAYATMAKVPKDKAEFLIEQSPPINPKALAEMGVERKWNYAPFTAGQTYHMIAGGPLSRFLAFIKRHDVRALAADLNQDEAKHLRPRLVEVEEWCSELDRLMPKSKK